MHTYICTNRLEDKINVRYQYCLIVLFCQVMRGNARPIRDHDSSILSNLHVIPPLSTLD